MTSTRGLYLWTGVQADVRAHLLALRHRLPDRSVFSHRTAARILGVDVELRPSSIGRYELTVPPDVRFGSSSALCVGHAPLDPSDITLIHGIPITTPLRTTFDLARKLPLIEAVAATDAFLHSGLLRRDRFEAYISDKGGWHGVVRARRVVELAEPGAESLMESVLRMLLLQHGRPRPRVQHWVCDRRGRRIGRVDMWYEQSQLAVEYDGSWHRHNLADDNRRQNLLLEQGIKLLRFTASDVFQRPDVIAAQVTAHLKTSDSQLTRNLQNPRPRICN